ncbi:MAG: radical SAM protein [Caldithrix sp.]|nr:MAG: radical SAM protein [Caldithrix sp.]
MKEIPLKLLIKTITVKRLWNAGVALSSYFLSGILKKRFVWGRPFILTVEPTNICNLKCPLCVTGNGQMSRKAGLLDFKTFKKIMDEAGYYLFYLLLYQQGEPYLNRDFLRFVEYAKSKRIFVTTSTNAHFLNPETSERTVNSGLDSIIISIDGSDQKSYETYRVGGNLAEVKKGVQNLVREKIKQKSTTPLIYIQFIVMRHNEHQIAEMEKLTKDLGADKLLIKTVQVETLKEAGEWLPGETNLRRYNLEGDLLKPKRVGSGPCPRPWTSSLVNWDGSVVPCCFAKNGEHTFGSIQLENDFDKIWHSEKYANFRTKMLTDRSSIDICSNCTQGLGLYL